MLRLVLSLLSLSQHLIFMVSFHVAVFIFSIYRFVIQLYRKYFHHHHKTAAVDHDGKQTSNHAIVWNKLIRLAVGHNLKSVASFRQASRRYVPLLYPPLQAPYFGCAEKVEKIDKLRNSYWITMKKHQRHQQQNTLHSTRKVMLFIHGGGFISGHPIGLDAQSVLFSINDFNKSHSSSSNTVKCSHVLSVEYRLNEDPKSYATMDRNALCESLDDQLQDCFDCFMYLIEELKIPAKDIILGGYSAGANHCMSLILHKLLPMVLRKDNSTLHSSPVVWPIHSVSLFSAPCDISNTIISNDQWRQENVLVLTKGMVDLIHMCVTVQDKLKYSILKNIKDMEEEYGDDEVWNALFQTKRWIINYSNHEELTPGNEYLVNLFQKNVQKLADTNPHVICTVVNENHQMHCYTTGYSVLPEAKRSMKTIMNSCF
ncbi:hypothetical protein C9374_003898 [Naegleria lovaniensis]|uniref:Alpha/beta hydrolase fold-3 domain-containing protein n=1 Tax=Naegleria lovaniensis TaxID=51637 RepID=A0AA88KT32_NAELO|nr:uncharacterized protein C9374_003898 [Naegleria lovaniensis]KAG2394134.1 hypothetical protein C9374_003898 [Naegleria lovaniensis]